MIKILGLLLAIILFMPMIGFLIAICTVPHLGTVVISVMLWNVLFKTTA